MSQQEALYETNQYFTYKGKKLRIRFNEEYFDLVPRPITEERQLLKESILEDGLTDEIKINVIGEVLDGHTRIEICEELGWKNPQTEKPIIPRYLVKEFEDKEKEGAYVIKTNLMRRHLNSFQKVRLASKLYIRYGNGKHALSEGNRYDILVELKKYGKPIRASVLCDSLGMARQNILKLLTGLKEDFCVRCEEEENPKDTGKAYLFSILPKGEEVLSKGKPEKITHESLGRSVGVGRVKVSQSLFLLDHAPPNMIARLEHGEIAVANAYTELTKEDRIKRVIPKKYIGRNSKVICPHCKQISTKREWKRYNGKD